MKKFNVLKVLLILLLCIGMTMSISAEEIDIVSTFTDPSLANYIADNFDVDKDGNLSDSEIAAITSIEALPSSVKELTGIDKLTSLASISISNTSVTNVDLSANKTLKIVYVIGRSVSSIDVKGLVSLEQLSIDDTSISTLDLSSNTSLSGLYIRDCKGLNEITFPNEGVLTYFTLENAPDLKSISFDETHLVTLMIDNVGIEAIDLSGATELSYLYVINTDITSIELENCRSLVSIDLSNGDITSIDTSNMAKLEYLTLNNTKVQGIDLKGNPNIRRVSAINAPLAYLNIYTNIRPTYTNKTSLALDVVGGSFDITSYFKSIDVSKIKDLKGATLSSNTISGYTTSDPNISYRYEVRSGSYIDVSIHLDIQKAEPVIELKNESKVYDEKPYVPVIDVSGELRYDVSYENIDESALDEIIDAGKYKMIVNVDGNDFYESDQKEFDVTIQKADPELNIVGQLTHAYGTSYDEIEYPNKANEDANITYERLDLSSRRWEKMEDEPDEAGVYRLTASIGESANYTSASVSRIFMIYQTLGHATIQEEMSHEYSGLPQDKPDVLRDSDGVVLYQWYRKDGDGLVALDESPEDVGEYVVYALVMSDTNHTGAIAHKDFTISKAHNYWVEPISYHDGEVVAQSAFGDVTIKYSLTSDGEYVTEKPNASVYYARAFVEGTDNYEALESDTLKIDMSIDLDGPQGSDHGPTISITHDPAYKGQAGYISCAEAFGDDYIYSKRYGACIIKYLVVDTSCQK